MVLTPSIVEKILNLVYERPRTIAEVAFAIGKNWRTADSYIEKISKTTGQIATHTFRGGTRGALKIVYWVNLEGLRSTEFQKRLQESILSARRKQDFSAFNIYQYVDNSKKSAFYTKLNDAKGVSRFMNLLASSTSQVLSFSGNLSWLKLSTPKESVVKVLEQLLDKNVSIKVLTRVDFQSMDRVQALLSLNYKLGKKLIEVRHAEQPLRGFIRDDNLAYFKEVFELTHFLGRKISQKLLLFYEIYDESWVEWLKNLFWNIFSKSISAERRIQEMKTLKDLAKL